MKKTISTNKKARHDYQILDKLEVGIKLTGAEVKSVKEGGVSLKESFVRIERGELYIKNMHIAAYKFARQEEYNAIRNRKLLANKKEITKLFGEMTQKKLTLIPLSIYLKNGRVKLKIALAKGKKAYDKREAIKKKDVERELRKNSNYQ